MKIENQIKTKLLFVVLVLFSFTSCDDFLDMDPLNSITQNQMWQTKEDVNKSLIDAYDKIQSCTETFFVWSEMGGELVSAGDLSSYNTVSNHTLTENSSFTSWSDIYSAISKINRVYSFAPQAQAIDATFSVKELQYYEGECIALRALCYFYLARTYLDLPYIKDASLTDDQEYIYSPSTNIVVLDSVIADLLKAEKLARPNWNDVALTDPTLRNATIKGRISKPVIYAILADAYLTRAAYCSDERDKSDVDPTFCFEQAVKYADMVIKYDDPVYRLMDGVLANWMKIFYPGNSAESIFDIQFMRNISSSFNDIGWMFARFRDNLTWHSNSTYETLKQWQGTLAANPYTDDNRGLGNSFNGTDRNPDRKIWKFRGMVYDEKGEDKNQRQNDVSDAINYPVYRIAEMYLIQAEALNCLGRRQEAIDKLLTVRKRAVLKTDEWRDNKETFLDLPETLTELEFEDELLNERAAELAAEGKRWYDLVRFAVRRNDSKIIIDRIVEARGGESERPKWTEKLFRHEAWYFPINRTELNNNAKLVQNKYYTTDFKVTD